MQCPRCTFGVFVIDSLTQAVWFSFDCRLTNSCTSTCAPPGHVAEGKTAGCVAGSSGTGLQIWPGMVPEAKVVSHALAQTRLSEIIQDVCW